MTIISPAEQIREMLAHAISLYVVECNISDAAEVFEDCDFLREILVVLEEIG